MKKALKILAGSAAVFLVLFGIASVALHVLLSPEQAKSIIQKQLTTYLKREVKMGEVSVGLLTGLKVSDLKVSEAPNFSKGTFITSDHFAIQLALIPLIFRKIEVKQLTFDRPVFQVVRLADGKTYNFSDLVTPSTATTVAQVDSNPFAIPLAFADAPTSPATPQTEPSFSFVVSNADVHQGTLHFIDRSPAQESFVITALDLDLKNVSMNSPFGIQTSLQFKAHNVSADLKLAGEADLGSDSFKIKSCSLSSAGSALELSGQASRLRSASPSADLTLKVKEFKLSTLAGLVNLPPALRLNGPIVANAHVKGDQEKMNVDVQIDLAKVQVAYGKQFQKPAQVPMSASLKGDLLGLKDFQIAEFKAVLASLQATSHGKIWGVRSTQPQIKAHVETNTFSVPEILQIAAVVLPKDVSVKGRAQLAADLSGTQMSSQMALKLEGKELEFASGETFHKPAGLPMRLALAGERVRDTMTIQNMTANLGTTEITGAGTIQTGGKTPRFQLNFKSKAVDLQEVAKLSTLAAPYRPSGRATLDLKVSGTTAAPQTVGSLGLQGATLHHEETEFSQIAATVGFTQQDVSIPKLTCLANGSEMMLKMTGHRLNTQPDIHIEGNIKELDLAKWLAAAPAPAARNPFASIAWAAAAPPSPPMKLSGVLTVGHIKHEFYDAKDTELRWDLSDVTADLSQVSGGATLKQGTGVVKEVEKLVANSKAARVILLPLVTLQKLDRSGKLEKLGLPSLQKIPFNGIRGDYAFDRGTMNIKVFELMGKDVNINTQGTVGLAGTQPLDLRVTTRFGIGVIRGTVGKVLQDESGRVSLSFIVKGTIADPDAKPQWADVSQKAVGGILKGLGLGGSGSQNAPSEQQGQAAPAPQDPAAPAPAQSPNSTDSPQQKPRNPNDDLQKVLDIFKKR